VPKEWSESILIADLADEPGFSEELSIVIDELTRGQGDGGGGGAPGSDAHAEATGRDEGPPADVVIDMSGVSYLNSSNIAQLLRLRDVVRAGGGRLRIAGVNDDVWGVIMVTGLEKVFEFAGDKATAIASLQLLGDDDANQREPG
jgi:anti-anti-sigma regulatory factor